MIQGDQKVQAEDAMDAQKGFGFSSALQSLLSELSQLIGWQLTQCRTAKATLVLIYDSKENVSLWLRMHLRAPNKVSSSSLLSWQ